jgi:hypothetical protein
MSHAKIFDLNVNVKLFVRHLSNKLLDHLPAFVLPETCLLPTPPRRISSRAD